jgi:molecular chaperone GrpE
MIFITNTNTLFNSGDNSSGGEQGSHSSAPSSDDGSRTQQDEDIAEATGSAQIPDQLEAKVAELSEKLQETNDRMLRIAAEFENSRKRWEKEKADLKTYCISEFARDLLPVIDSFDKAMTAIEQLTVNVETEEGKQVTSIVEGVQLVSKVMSDALKKHGVEKLPGKGEAFNPNFHNAIAKTVDATLQQEMVVDEFVSGYRIGERILRTAMVRVASPD